MNDRMRSVLVGAGAAAFTMAAVSTTAYAVSSQLLRLALDREAPKLIEKSRQKISGEDESFARILQRLEQGARQLESMGCCTVKLTAHDGVQLVGHWFENPQAQRVVVAMHGWRSSWSQDFGMVADFMHKNGCSVLYAEQRGQNGSGGRHITFGLLERFDCRDWINWVTAHTVPGLPVYLVGISMGATTVLMTAGLDLPDSVRGIVADCGFTSPHDIWKHVAENNLHLRYDLHDGWVERLCRRKIHMGGRDYSTLDAMRVCRVPVLFVHGTDDTFVPVTMTYENYKACAAPKELLIVPGAAHGMSYLTEQSRYRQAVLSFWRRWDRV